MKKIGKRVVSSVLILLMCASLAGCGQAYTAKEKRAVESKARLSAISYLFKNKFGAFIYDVDAVAPFVLFYKDSLYNEAECNYLYGFEKHSLLVNNEDGRIYTDDYIEYACDALNNRYAGKLGLPEDERVEVVYYPECSTTTTKRTDGRTYDASYAARYFPAEYTKEDVDEYIADGNVQGYLGNITVYSNRSCKDFEEILPISKYRQVFDLKAVKVFCRDGYVEYEADDHESVNVTVYCNDHVTYDDRVRIEFYDQYKYTYERSHKDSKYVVSQKVFTDYNSKDFTLKFGAGGNDKAFSLDLRRDIHVDIYLKNYSPRTIERVSHIENRYQHTDRYRLKKIEDGWKKVYSSAEQERKLEQKNVVSEEIYRSMYLSKGTSYIFR